MKIQWKEVLNRKTGKLERVKVKVFFPAWGKMPTKYRSLVGDQKPKKGKRGRFVRKKPQ